MEVLAVASVLSHMANEDDTMVTLPIMDNLTFREFHAFVNGLYCGLVEAGREHEYDKEKHYWRGGYIIGAGTRYGCLVGLIHI